MKRVVVLGSTGSIGKQTAEIVRKNKGIFKIVGLSTNRRLNLLEKQVIEFNPQAVVVANDSQRDKLKQRLKKRVKILVGQDGLSSLAALDGADIVLNALVGSVGLESTLAALKAKKALALANKESMVAGGQLVVKLQKKNKTQIVPVDSEHSAIFQCLLGENKEEVKKIILTSSGGPFRGKKAKELEKATVKQALAHPRWRMGKKISIDSATLMNKGLEVIEAHFLFGIPYDQIEVVIHPQSIIHSMVEFKDGSIKAHLGQTDMRIPIQYALSYPARLDSPLRPLDFFEVEELTFAKPDYNSFPCLRYAIWAGKEGKTYPVVLNAANEEAVAAFLERRIDFTSIPVIISKVLDKHDPQEATGLEVIKKAEDWARELVKKLIEREKDLL